MHFVVRILYALSLTLEAVTTELPSHAICLATTLLRIVNRFTTVQVQQEQGYGTRADGSVKWGQDQDLGQQTDPLGPILGLHFC